ncbi:MAG TPA: hypothetical protein VF658_18625 [Pyrinomonadaceae bacterium]
MNAAIIPVPEPQAKQRTMALAAGSVATKMLEDIAPRSQAAFSNSK